MRPFGSEVQVPSTDEVRSAYATGMPDTSMIGRLFRAKFDAWLAAHDAEVRADAERERDQAWMDGWLVGRKQTVFDKSRVTEAREAGRREGLAQGWDEGWIERARRQQPWLSDGTQRDPIPPHPSLNPYREAGDDGKH